MIQTRGTLANLGVRIRRIPHCSMLLDDQAQRSITMDISSCFSVTPTHGAPEPPGSQPMSRYGLIKR